MLCFKGQATRGRQEPGASLLRGSLGQSGFRFFFRECCLWSALLVGPEGGAEIAQL